MRSQSYVGVVLLIGIIACAWLGIAVAGDEANGNEQMCLPLGVITLKPPETVEPKRAAVAFNHGQHLGLACNNCHHAWEGTEPVVGCMTSGCHDLDTMPRKEGSNSIDKALAFRYYKSAYHKQCIGCHKTMQQEIDKLSKTLADLDEKLPVTGPTGCIGCHPKE